MRALIVVSCLIAISKAHESGALQCGWHEVESCVKECPPERTCRNRGIAFSCLNDDKPCTPKCVCEDGHYRNAIGECITGAECDKCQAKNEFYSCNSACDNVCADIATQNRTHCPIKNIQCNKWCYCDDGYARDDKKNCVPVSECPKTDSSSHGRYSRAVSEEKCKDPNEIPTCKTDCPPETCMSLVAKYKCDSREVCKTRCACKDGYLRMEDGSPCIPICDCPEMKNSLECSKKVY